MRPAAADNTSTTKAERKHEAGKNLLLLHGSISEIFASATPPSHIRFIPSIEYNLLRHQVLVFCTSDINPGEAVVKWYVVSSPNIQYIVNITYSSGLFFHQMCFQLRRSHYCPICSSNHHDVIHHCPCQCGLVTFHVFSTKTPLKRAYRQKPLLLPRKAEIWHK